MAKAEVRKADMWRLAVGAAIERTRILSGLSLKEFARDIGRDERQIARWIDGTDRPQFDAIFGVDALRQPLVIALAELAGHGVELQTVITIRRTL